MRITTNLESVLTRITGNESYILIGELHNSRSAIQFIMDNIDCLIPKSDRRKTYFLTEFLPTGLSLQSNKRNKNQYLVCKIQMNTSLRRQLSSDLSQREKDRSNPETRYTLDKLYKAIFPKVEEIFSIELQPDAAAAAELKEKVDNGDVSAYKQRVDQVNQRAHDKVKEIIAKDKDARIIIFAGMGHTANTTIRKFDKQDGKTLAEIPLDGIDGLLKQDGLSGLCISIHDIQLCTDKALLADVDHTTESFSKYEIDDDCITTDKSDFLLFMETPCDPKAKKIIKKGFESIFLPNKCDFVDFQDLEKRKAIISSFKGDFLGDADVNTAPSIHAEGGETSAASTTAAASIPNKSIYKKQLFITYVKRMINMHCSFVITRSNPQKLTIQCITGDNFDSTHGMEKKVNEKVLKTLLDAILKKQLSEVDHSSIRIDHNDDKSTLTISTTTPQQVEFILRLFNELGMNQTATLPAQMIFAQGGASEAVTNKVTDTKTNQSHVGCAMQ